MCEVVTQLGANPAGCCCWGLYRIQACIETQIGSFSRSQRQAKQSACVRALCVLACVVCLSARRRHDMHAPERLRSHHFRRRRAGSMGPSALWTAAWGLGSMAGLNGLGQQAQSVMDRTTLAARLSRQSIPQRERVCVRFRSTPPPPRLSNQRQGHPLNQLFPSPWNGRRPGHGMAQNLLAQVTRTVGTDGRPIVYSCRAGCCWLLLAACWLTSHGWSHPIRFASKRKSKGASMRY